MAWRRKQKIKAAPAENAKAPPPPPPDQGPVRTVLPDGTIEEWSAATGRSVIIPARPAKPGLDLRPAALGWGGWAEIRRRIFGS
jgi:hypothetical protein